MIVSIIIISFNSEKYLGKCIESIGKNTGGLEYEIIVVDNSSVDDSFSLIKNKFPGVILIENKKNEGFARAVNRGIKASKGEFIFLLNPDTVLVNNAIKIFYEFLINNDEYTCCGGALFDERMKPVNSYGFFPSVKQVMFEEFGLRKIFKKYYFNKLSPGCVLNQKISSPFLVDYVSGADMFIRKSALEKTGLLDEDFFMYYEETELSYRIIKNNFKIAVIPEAKIIHFEGKSLIGVNLEKYKLMLKSEFLFFKKCYGKFITFILKVTLLLGCTVKLVLKFDAEQVDKFKLIIKSN